MAGDLTWGVAQECAENPNCGPGLERVYGITRTQRFMRVRAHTSARELLNLPAANRARAKERLRFRVILHRAQPIDVTVAVAREPMP